MSKDCKYTPQISTDTASTEMVECPRTQTDASSTDLQAYCDLITEQRHHFSSQLQELESMLLSKTERAQLLDGTLSTMKQLSDIMQETSAGVGTLPEPEKGIPATRLVSLEAVQTGKTIGADCAAREKVVGATGCDASTGLEPVEGEGRPASLEMLKPQRRQACLDAGEVKEDPAPAGLTSEARKDGKQGIVNACFGARNCQVSDTFKPSGSRAAGETAPYAKATPPTSPLMTVRNSVPRLLASSTGVLRSSSMQDTSRASPPGTLNTNRYLPPGRAVAPSCKRKCQTPQSSINRPALQCQDRSKQFRVLRSPQCDR